jgi:hypothetical protein
MPSTPRTRTFGELKVMGARYVLLPQDTEALEVAGDGVKEGINKLNMRSWGFNLTYDDITFSADEEDYALSSGFKKPYHFELNDTSGNPSSRLYFRDPKTFWVEFPAASSTRNTTTTPWSCPARSSSS